MGCVEPERPADRQVHIQYSVDFGVTWRYLVPQCLPADPRCGGQVSQPSVFFPAEGWKRAVYSLPDSLADTYAAPPRSSYGITFVACMLKSTDMFWFFNRCLMVL